MLYSDSRELFCFVEATIAVLGLVALWSQELTTLNGSQGISLGSKDSHFSLCAVANDLEQEDFVDGLVLSEDEFWKKITLRKLALIVFQLADVVLYTYTIASTCSRKTGPRAEILNTSASVLSSLILLFLAIFSLRHSQRNHSFYILYLSVLITIRSLALIAFALYPVAELVANPFMNRSQRSTNIIITLVTWVIVATTPRGPSLRLAETKVYQEDVLANCEPFDEANVCEQNSASPLGLIFFSYATRVFMLGRSNIRITLSKLPILPAQLRARVNFAGLTSSMIHFDPAFKTRGLRLAYHLVKVNIWDFIILQAICVVACFSYYAPIYFIQEFLAYLDSDNKNKSTGWYYVAGILITYTLIILADAQKNAFTSQNLKTKLKLQLTTLLYAKTLVRKDISLASPAPEEGTGTFSSKAEVMNLMTTDVSRVSEFTRLSFSPTESLLGIAIGGYMLYNLLGSSALIGLAIGTALMPLNQVAIKIVLKLQMRVMKSRDERASLTNELLSAIRMIKLMAWERGFEKRILSVRNRELAIQKRIFVYQNMWSTLSDSIPLLFALGSFCHFSVIRKQELTPSIAFTAIVIFGEIKYPLQLLPECLTQIIQAFVSLQRLQTYLDLPEVSTLSPDAILGTHTVGLQSATISWGPAGSTNNDRAAPSNHLFTLSNLTTNFPTGKISLICGKIGSGKTLILLALLGEAEILSGQVICPRNHINTFGEFDPAQGWLIAGMLAYVPQTPWLRNQTLKDNILFHAPFDAQRYEAVLEACALLPDIAVLDDGDQSELGEQGINLSGGQKARVSLARALYSRASILLLDDVLSAVDSHTAHHLWSKVFKGELMLGRTVILVSHHIQLCGPDAAHIIALEGGRLKFSGSWLAFADTPLMKSMVNYTKEENQIELGEQQTHMTETVDKGAHPLLDSRGIKESKSKANNEEAQFDGHISIDIWRLYAEAAGKVTYHLIVWTILVIAALFPLGENGWLKIWSSDEKSVRNAQLYVGIYAVLIVMELAIKIVSWIVVYEGTIHASAVIFERFLQAILFANLRFHDTTSRGRILNRFGKDFYGVDTVLSYELGRTLMIGLALVVTTCTLTYVNGWPLALACFLMYAVAYWIAEIYGRVARDIRRIASRTASPLFGLYSETISGLAVVRAFGMSKEFFKAMTMAADTNMNPEFWTSALNRWVAVRFQITTAILTSLVAAVSLVTPSIGASWAGVALAFSTTLTLDMYWLLRRWIDVEQSMVALERINEYAVLSPEGPEFVEPRPPKSWPSEGHIKVDNLVVRYAPHLPDALQEVSFEVKSREKIGLVGRTGSGKSTLALALFRFVEARMGSILIDGIDIKRIGLNDLRRNLTIVPQDPVLLSGSIRSTLDVSGEFEDSDIYEALRRVSLLNEGSVFSDLDTSVLELGSNFSTGERQLLCLARAFLRRSKILVMDEATASVDYATDSVISKTIREEFANCTLITIAHRLRTVIDYDRIIVMDQGRIVEIGKPSDLIRDTNSKFFAMCQACGPQEFASLKALAKLNS